MFFLIRGSGGFGNNEVLGIVNDCDILTPEEYEDMIENYMQSALLDTYYAGCVMTKRVQYIIQSNIKIMHWSWDNITQAEYETYRDLHEFTVFTRPAVLKGIGTTTRLLCHNPQLPEEEFSEEEL